MERDHSFAQERIQAVCEHASGEDVYFDEPHMLWKGTDMTQGAMAYLLLRKLRSSQIS
jgi:hypothetical protein